MNIDKYSKYADNLIFDSQEVVFAIGQAYKELQEAIIKDPSNIDKYKKIYDKKISKIAKEFDVNWKKWADEDLPTAYIKGIKDAENNLSKVGVNSSITDPISNGRMLLREFPPPPAIPAIPGQVSMLFSGKYADHETFFGVFRQSAYYSLDGQQLQIMRYSDDLFRQTASMVAENNFNEMDIFTRRKFSQEMLDEFARKGVQSVTYKNGAKYSIDTYSEMVGRTLTSRCAIQANLNRYMQSGWDLVIVSAHFMCCELCSPYEGQTLSINPGHQVYESLDDAIRNGLYHCNCYSLDTEVYTSNGWKLFNDVESDDKIFSLNPLSHIPEWSGWKTKFKNFEKEMIEFKSNSYDLLVTKNHNMYIGFNTHEKNNKRILRWRLESAENSMKKNFKQLKCVNWDGIDLNYNTYGFGKKDFAYLLGIFMSEGNIHEKYIRISQYKENAKKILNKRLISMGFKEEKSGYILKNEELAIYLKQFGKQPERFIPDYLLNEKTEIIKEFLDAFIIGDGSVRKSKSKLNINSISKKYFTSSKKLADHIGECIIKIGKYPSFSLQKTKGKLQKHKNGEYICNYNIWIIRENNSRILNHNISKSNKHKGIKSKIIDSYNNYVYCLELEKNHIMLVRRNGKISWCGNCIHDLSPYFEGISDEIVPSVSDGEQMLIDEYGRDEAQKIAYEAKQKQRYIERKIRNWKRRETVSIDPRSKDFSSKKVRTWQAKQREHLKENSYLPRKYEREQIKKAH
ncbi:MAG: phage minor capsid protein [Methanogenium sp.]|jgi:hypothetical protein